MFFFTISISLIVLEGFAVNYIDILDENSSLTYGIKETKEHLRRIATPLIEDSESDLEKALTLMNWVHNEIKLDFTHGYDTYLHPIEILNNSRGGCGQYAIVFTSLCLVSGIKSRIIAIENNSGSGHILSEVLLGDKWKVFDPHFNIYYNYSAWDLHNNKKLITKPLEHVEFFRTLYDNIRIEYSENYYLEDFIFYDLTRVNDRNYEVFYGKDTFLCHYEFRSTRHPLLFSLVIFIGDLKLIYPILPTMFLVSLILIINEHRQVFYDDPNDIHSRNDKRLGDYVILNQVSGGKHI